MRAPLATLAFAIAGCSLSHEPAPEPIDAGRLPDGAAVVCEIGGFTRCDGACGMSGHAACDRGPPLYETCFVGLCIWDDPATGVGQHCGDHGSSCTNDLACLYDSEMTGSVCIDGWRCDEAAEVGYSIDCRWWDGTPRTSDPPPVAECPAAPFPSTPFCGAGCAPCPYVFSPDPLGATHIEPGCFGISDTRGLGICGVSYRQGCLRGVRSGIDVCHGNDPGGIGIPELFETRCVCLVTRGHDTADGLADDGWATSEEGCRAYRDRYPDDIECVTNREWSTLP